MVVILSENTTNATLMLGLGKASGTVWFDNVSLETTPLFFGWKKFHSRIYLPDDATDISLNIGLQEASPLWGMEVRFRRSLLNEERSPTSH